MEEQRDPYVRTYIVQRRLGERRIKEREISKQLKGGKKAGNGSLTSDQRSIRGGKEEKNKTTSKEQYLKQLRRRTSLYLSVPRTRIYVLVPTQFYADYGVAFLFFLFEIHDQRRADTQYTRSQSTASLFALCTQYYNSCAGAMIMVNSIIIAKSSSFEEVNYQKLKQHSLFLVFSILSRSSTQILAYARTQRPPIVVCASLSILKVNKHYFFLWPSSLVYKNRNRHFLPCTDIQTAHSPSATYRSVPGLLMIDEKHSISSIYIERGRHLLNVITQPAGGKV